MTKVEGVSWFVYRTDFSNFYHVSTGRVIGDHLNAMKIFVAGGTDVLLEEGMVEQSVAGQGRWSINTSYFGVDGRDSPDPTKFNEAGLYDMFFIIQQEYLTGLFR